MFVPTKAKFSRKRSLYHVKYIIKTLNLSVRCSLSKKIFHKLQFPPPPNKTDQVKLRIVQQIVQSEKHRSNKPHEAETSIYISNPQK